MSPLLLALGEKDLVELVHLGRVRARARARVRVRDRV